MSMQNLLVIIDIKSISYMYYEFYFTYLNLTIMCYMHKKLFSKNLGMVQFEILTMDNVVTEVNNF